MSFEAMIIFLAAAIALLGSPGPAIAALVALGRAKGVLRGMGFFVSMQVGLAIAAAISVAGVISLFQALPWLKPLLIGLSVIYMLWLAWTIATSELSGGVGGAGDQAFTLPFGFFLGIANPKAYLAFASLFGSFAIATPAFGFRDGLTKWAACVIVMIVVDFAWLYAGAALGRIKLTSRAERGMNVVMGGAIAVAGVISLF